MCVEGEGGHRARFALSTMQPHTARLTLTTAAPSPPSFLSLQGLEDVVGLSVTHPTWQRTRPDQDEHTGWTFAAPGDAPFSSSTGFGSFRCAGVAAPQGHRIAPRVVWQRDTAAVNPALHGSFC